MNCFNKTCSIISLLHQSFLYSNRPVVIHLLFSCFTYLSSLVLYYSIIYYYLLLFIILLLFTLNKELVLLLFSHLHIGTILANNISSSLFVPISGYNFVGLPSTL